MPISRPTSGKRRYYFKGWSKATIQKNIRQAIDRGHTPKQAIAIAYSLARQSRKKKK